MISKSDSKSYKYHLVLIIINIDYCNLEVGAWYPVVTAAACKKHNFFLKIPKLFPLEKISHKWAGQNPERNHR